MNTIETERQFNPSPKSQTSARDSGFDSELPSRLIDKLEQLQFLQAELLGKAQAWNRIALISETDANGNIISVNDNFIRTSGYTRDELIGQNHNLLKSGHQHDGVFEQMWQTLLAGKVWRGYLKNKNQKGDYFWVYSTIFPILNENRTPVRFYSVAIPVTELIEPTDDLRLNLLPAFSLTPDAQSRQLQQLRQQLQTLKAEYDHALRAIHQALMIAETDSRGIITAVNDYFVEVSGFERHELVGQNHRLIKSPEQSPRVYDELWNTITQGKVWRGMLINRRKDGTDYRVEIQIIPELDEEGKVRRYLALSWLLGEAVDRAFADSSQLNLLRVELELLNQQHHESQRMIAELESMQQLLFSQVSALNAAAYVLETDLNGQITFVNDSFVSRSGFARESLFGKSVLSLVTGTHPTSELNALERSLANHNPWRGFVLLSAQNGENFWVHLVLHPIENLENGAIEKYVLILFDAQNTQQRVLELEQELVLLRGQEQELQRTVTDLFYKTNHLQKLLQQYEIRNTGIEQAFPIIETDPSGIVLFVNDVFCRQYATRPADWMGKGLDSWLATRMPLEKADDWLARSRSLPTDPLILPPQTFDLNPIAYAAYTCPIHDTDGNWVKQLYLLVPVPEITLQQPASAPEDTTEYQELAQANQQLKQQLEELQQRYATLEQASVDDKNRQQQVIDTLQSQLADLEAAQKAHSLENYVPIETLKAAELARETLEQRIQALVRDKEAVHNNFLKANESLEQLQTQYNNLKRELDDERQWAAELQERYAQLEHDFKTLEVESEARKTEIQQIRSGYTELKQRNDAAAESLQELQQQLEAAYQRENQLKIELSKQVAELESLKLRLEKTDLERLVSENEIASLKSRLENLQLERRIIEDEVRVMKNRFERQIQERRVMEDEARGMKEQIERLVAERDTLNRRLQLLEQQSGQLKAQLESVIAQAQSLTQTNDHLKSRVRELEEQLTAHQAVKPEATEEIRKWVGFSPPDLGLAPQVAASRKRILFAEADHLQLELAKNWINSRGFEHKVASRGDEALALYESFQPEIVLLDLRLPGLNGIELVDVIRNDYEDLKTPIIALAPAELLVHRAEYLRSGFTEVIAKPYSQADLEYTLQQLNLLA